MKADFSQLSPDEREARITAMILGELSETEANEILRAIADDPELARVYRQRKQTVGLVRAATVISEEPAADAAPLRLSDERREKLLETFRSSAAAPASRRRGQRILLYVPLSLAAALVGLLVVASLSVSHRTKEMASLRELDSPSVRRSFSKAGEALNEFHVAETPSPSEPAPLDASVTVATESDEVSLYMLRKAEPSSAMITLNDHIAPTGKDGDFDRAEPARQPALPSGGAGAGLAGPEAAQQQRWYRPQPLAASRQSGAESSPTDKTPALEAATSPSPTTLATLPQFSVTDAPRDVAGKEAKTDFTQVPKFQTGSVDLFSQAGAAQFGFAGTPAPRNPQFGGVQDSQTSAGDAFFDNGLLGDRYGVPRQQGQTDFFQNIQTAQSFSDNGMLGGRSGAERQQGQTHYFESIPANTDQRGLFGSGGGFGRGRGDGLQVEMNAPQLGGGSFPMDGTRTFAGQEGRGNQTRSEPVTNYEIRMGVMAGLPIAEMPAAKPEELDRLRELKQEQLAAAGNVYRYSPPSLMTPRTLGMDREEFDIPQAVNDPVAAGRGRQEDVAKPSQPGQTNPEQLKLGLDDRLGSIVRPHRGDETASKDALTYEKKLADASAIAREKKMAGEFSDLAPETAQPRPALTPQPEVQTRTNPFSTFSLNVTDVSFQLAAASLERGVMPEAASIRSEEFINAFDYRDPQPVGVPVAFAWERARYPFAHNRDLLRFSIQTAAEGRANGKPLNLVLLLDNSGSMERADRVRIIQESLRTLAAQLSPQDKLSVVTFARTPRLQVDGASGAQAAAVAQQVGSLTPEGGTNLEDALALAYATAQRHYAATSINRIVLLTDGAANLGRVEPETLQQKVETFRRQGIALDCFGIGWEGLNDELLETLSRHGDGRYGFVNTPEEAATEFAAKLAGALRVAASDVKVQVKFNPARVTAYRQIGYAKHQLTKEQFRDNTVDAAEIAALEAGNALYVIETNPQGAGPIGVVRVRYRIPGTAEYREHEWTVPFTPAVPELTQSRPALRLAGSAAAFSEWLASNPFAGEVTTDRLLEVMAGVPEAFGADPRPRRLEWMIRQAKSISGR